MNTVPRVEILANDIKIHLLNSDQYIFCS